MATRTKTTSNELKSLQVRQNMLNNEVVELRRKSMALAQEIAVKRAEMEEINTRMSDMHKKDIVVTEHAILRYVERVMGIDTEAIKARILSPENRRAIGFAGSCKIKSDGLTFVVKNRAVVSVIAKD